MKWFVHSSLNLVGYDSYDVFETNDDDEDVADDIGWEHYAMPWAESFFSVIDPYDEDAYVADGEEYMGTFIFVDDVFCYVEPYDEEKHKGKL